MPASSAPPAEVPCVSPSMKYAAACSAFSLATAGMMFSLRLRISRKSADSSSRASAASIEENEKVARPFWVYDVSKKSTLPSSS